MRPFRPLAVALAAALTLAGCGGSVTSGASGNDSRAKADQKVYDRLGALTGADRRTEMVKEAKKEGQLTLYTSFTDDVAADVVAAFTKQFGIKVNLFRGNSETVLQRVLQETGAGKTGNDVVETNFAEMATMAQKGLMTPFKGAVLDNVEQTGRFDDWTASRRTCRSTGRCRARRP